MLMILCRQAMRKGVFQMRKVFAEIMNRLTRFPTILATLFIGCAFVLATGAYAAAGDKKVEIEKPEKNEKIERVEKIDNILKAKGVDSKGFVNERGVFINEVDFNPFFRPFDDFFIVNNPEQFEVN